MIIICDDKKILSLAGVMGGKNSCCDPNTKKYYFFRIGIFFTRKSISKTGRKLNIQSMQGIGLKEE